MKVADMYESFFGLGEAPFSLSPDPRFLWLSETHQEGLSALCYGIMRRKGFILLTGEIGAGKTTLLRSALGHVGHDSQAALITTTMRLGPLDLLKLMAAEFQFEVRSRTMVDHLIALKAFLLERLEAGLNTVLVIDEAQNLGVATLEYVRLLSNLETERDKLLQIVLTGQPELLSRLNDPRLGPLRQRIAIQHHVEVLRADQTLPYLRHRIEVAGGTYEEVLEPGSEPTFHSFSGGSPRLINLLADRVLLSAFSQGMRPASRALVEERAKELAPA